MALPPRNKHCIYYMTEAGQGNVQGVVVRVAHLTHENVKREVRAFPGSLLHSEEQNGRWTLPGKVDSTAFIQSLTYFQAESLPPTTS